MIGGVLECSVTLGAYGSFLPPFDPSHTPGQLIAFSVLLAESVTLLGDEGQSLQGQMGMELCSGNVWG